MASKLKVSLKKSKKIAERLAFLKKRYKKLILEPRKEIESEIEKDLNEEDSIKIPPVDRLCQ
ncbi:MAG: hypothetical protein R2568_10185 [Candidatus Scalindua sp.]|nr:hypothetical protein [Candidatus Scalindua sp.]MDV5167097.1 hypothetical protein [Candidatus Scalindua sp.]